MDTESKRIADSFRRDYERAAAAQAAIEGNLAAAQQLTITNNETAVRLRDLEREADATRTLYESFLNRAHHRRHARTDGLSRCAIATDGVLRIVEILKEETAVAAMQIGEARIRPRGGPGDAVLRTPITGIAFCCARVVHGAKS